MALSPRMGEFMMEAWLNRVKLAPLAGTQIGPLSEYCAGCGFVIASQQLITAPHQSSPLVQCFAVHAACRLGKD